MLIHSLHTDLQLSRQFFTHPHARLDLIYAKLVHSQGRKRFPKCDNSVLVACLRASSPDFVTILMRKSKISQLIFITMLIH